MMQRHLTESLAALPPMAVACLDAVPQCVQVFTVGGRLVAINPAGLRMLEIDDYHAFHGRHWEDVWPDLPREQLRQGMARAEQGETASFMSFCSTMKGNTRWWEKTISPLRGPDGRTSHILWVAHDISELKRSKLQLRSVLRIRDATLATLNCSDEQTVVSGTDTLALMVGQTAHDITNVLMAVSGILDLATRAGTQRLPDDVVVAGRDAVQRGTKMLRQLLDVSRAGTPGSGDIAAAMDSTRTDDILGSVDSSCAADILGAVDIRVSRLLRDSAGLLAALAGNGITVEIVAAGDDHIVTAPPGTLDGVFFNLVANARDAMPAGGRIRIDVQNCCRPAQQPSRVNHEINQDGATTPLPHVRIEISDTGVGMTPEVLAKAGQPFFTTKPPDRGTGLGLASVFQFVRLLGGSIQLHSELCHGTSVTIYLPVKEDICP